MKMPISELIDRTTILTLKMERFPDQEKPRNSYDVFNEAYLEFVESLGSEQQQLARTYFAKLYMVNSRIWDVEAEIRSGLDKQLGLDEIGRRAIRVRNLNGVRARVKNEICQCFNESEYLDTKVDHVSNLEIDVDFDSVS